MICVYPADCTDFSTNGNGTLAPLSAEVTETLNGEYELTVVHPIDDEGKWQRLVEGCLQLQPALLALQCSPERGSVCPEAPWCNVSSSGP